MGKGCLCRRGGQCVWAICLASLGWILSAGPKLTLAIAYILVSTTAIFPALDWIMSPPVASDVNFPCDGHGCGCNTAADCRNGCCCYPNYQEPVPNEDKGMCITSTGCSGAPGELASSLSLLLPHLLDKPILLNLPRWSRRFRSVSVSHPVSALLDPPDSVPRCQALNSGQIATVTDIC
ncbi:MAG: hypothetical protein GY794_09295 [bacterium]|nr:hypothetical protein [bacterium]